MEKSLNFVRLSIIINELRIIREDYPDMDIKQHFHTACDQLEIAASKIQQAEIARPIQDLYKKLFDLIIQYRDIKPPVKKKIEKPVQPAYFSSLDFFSEYDESLLEYNNNERLHVMNHGNYLSTMQKLKWQIIGLMPADHTWFISPDKTTAVAIQRSTWPQDPPQLLIVTDFESLEKLPKLKLQVIND